MTTAKIKQDSNGMFLLVGKLTFSSVASLWNRSKLLLETTPSPIQIDLKSVTQSDSAGVALLISWVRYARQLNKEMHLMHLPEQMRAIIKVSGLSQLLPIQ